MRISLFSVFALLTGVKPLGLSAGGTPDTLIHCTRQYHHHSSTPPPRLSPLPLPPPIPYPPTNTIASGSPTRKRHWLVVQSFRYLQQHKLSNHRLLAWPDCPVHRPHRNTNDQTLQTLTKSSWSAGDMTSSTACSHALLSLQCRPNRFIGPARLRQVTRRSGPPSVMTHKFSVVFLHASFRCPLACNPPSSRQTRLDVAPFAK